LKGRRQFLLRWKSSLRSNHKIYQS
jgi:hypothetical protein